MMVEQGYRFNIYQSPETDLCHAVPGAGLARCYTYPIPMISSIGQTEMSTVERAAYLFKTLTMQSSLLQSMVKSWGFENQTGLSNYSDRTMGMLVKDVLSSPGSSYFHAHFLAPHGPFVYDSDCQFRNDTELWERAGIFASDPAFANSKASRSTRYGNYLGQVLCTQRKLNELFGQLRSADLFDSAIIIVHGDHGPRITTLRNLVSNRSNLSQDDLRDYYSTLFAVKLDGQLPAYHQAVIPLEVLMAKTAEAITGQSLAYPEEKPFVYLDGFGEDRIMETDIFEP